MYVFIAIIYAKKRIHRIHCPKSAALLRTARLLTLAGVNEKSVNAFYFMQQAKALLFCRQLRAQLLGQGGHNLVQVTHNAIISHVKDRSGIVLVDGNDDV